MPELEVKRLGYWATKADEMLEPLMKGLMWANFTPSESPMLTHRWNNHHFSADAVALLNRRCMVEVEGDPKAWRLRSFLRHLPWIGWQNYVVIGPLCHDQSWHLGWAWDGGAGVSRIVLREPGRALRGPDNVWFFGINAKTGRQIPVREMGRGYLGDGGVHRRSSFL